MMRLTVRSAFMAPRVFSLCEGSRLGGTAMVYIYVYHGCARGVGLVAPPWYTYMFMIVFVFVFQNSYVYLCTIMAEGGYDPTDPTKRSIGVHYVYVPQPVVLPIGEAEVRTWVNTKLRTKTLIGRNVVGVLLLFEGWVVRQSVLALNSAHLKQDLSCGVVHVKLIEGSDLVTKIQGGGEQHFTRNATPRCRAPKTKVQLLWPKAHVRLCQPLSRVFCACELDLGLCEDLPELGGEIVCGCHVDFDLLVKDISSTLCYAVRQINHWDWRGLVLLQQ